MKQAKTQNTNSDESLPTTIWLCGQKTSQVQRKGRYASQSNVHPAKMLPELARKIILTYSREGDLILDPMAGIGTTLVEAIHLDRKAIGVEYEEKFVRLSQENIRLAEKQGAMGKAIVLKGDARDFESLLPVDLIATSPPYGELDPSQSHMVSKNRAVPGDPNYRPSWNRKIKEGYLGTTRPYADAIISSPPYGEVISNNKEGPGATADPGLWKREFKKRQLRSGKSRPVGPLLIEQWESGYSIDEENIGNRPYGEIDAVVMSPVYGDLLNRSKHQGGIVERDESLSSYKHGYSTSDKNLANQPYGAIDLVLSSPPYSCHYQGNGKEAALRRIDKLRKENPELVSKMAKLGTWENLNKRETSYSDDPANLGNLRHGDIEVVITSPPYEGCRIGSRKDPGGGANLRLPDGGFPKGKEGTRLRKIYGELGYDGAEENICNKKGSSYLSEMLKVYCQCFKVIKPGGFMIVVTKNFRRNKRMINLSGDTISLCLKAGFMFYQHVIAVLGKISDEGVITPRTSFWQILHVKKAKETGEPVCLIQHEDVLVFKKPQPVKPQGTHHPFGTKK